MEKGTLGVQFLVASCSRARGSELVSGVQCAFYWAFTKLKYKIWDTGKDGGDDDDDQYNADDDADDDHNGKGDGDDYDGCNSDAIRQISSFHVKKSKNRENLKKTSWA